MSISDNKDSKSTGRIQQIQEIQPNELKLPKKIYIGHMEYQVIRPPDLVKDDRFLSRSTNDMHKYYVQDGVHPAAARYQLFYLIHGTLSAIGITRFDESATRTVGNFIYSFLRHNKAASYVEGVSQLERAGMWIGGEHWSLEMMRPYWRNTGHMNTMSMCIQINSGVPPREQWETLWHELYHRAFDLAELDEEERDCVRMGHLLCNFLAFNELGWLYQDVSHINWSAPEYQGCRPRQADARRVKYEGPD